MQAFRPTDQSTVSLAATATTGNVALEGDPAMAYLIVNEGPSTAFFRFGSSSVTATVPSGATGGSTPIQPGTTQTFRPPVTDATHFAAICGTSGTATIYVTAGEGV